MRRFTTPALLFFLLTLAYAVKANFDGNGVKDPILQGSVWDAFSKRPVKGVTVFITSSKDKVEKSFTTDASGNFRIPRLPAGELTIILEKKGYKTYRREKLVLKEGMQLKLNIDISNDEENEANNVFHPLLRMMQW